MANIQTKTGLTGNQLKIIAMVSMTLDHIGVALFPQNLLLRILGRLAFPIYAFMIAEGYSHTSNVKAYAWRLFFFGLISEIPFNLIYSGSWIFPFHQNVMFTLLLGLLCIREIDRFRGEKTVKRGVVSALKIALFLLIGTVGFVDYGLTGILTVIAFYLFRNIKWAPLFQLVTLVLLYIVFFKGQSIELNVFGYNYFLPIQGFGVLALIPIWLYNGKRKKRVHSKVWQYAFYAFYPLHMLVIYAVYRLAF